MTPKHLTNAFFVIFITTVLCVAAASLFHKEEIKTHNVIRNIKISPEILTSEKTLEELIENLPDGSFKSNLMVILGADLNGDSDQLNEILRAYAQMKIKEMKKQNQL